MTTSEYLREFSSFYVEFIEENIGQLANGDYNFWYFQSIHVLKFHCQSNRGKI